MFWETFFCLSRNMRTDHLLSKSYQMDATMANDAYFSQEVSY